MWNVDPLPSSLSTRIAPPIGSEPTRERQPEPRAAVAPGGRRVDLGERVEEPVHAAPRDSDSRVADGQVEAIRARARRLGVDLHHHLAPLRELHGVREEVQQHLPQARGVAHDPLRDAVAEETPELDLLLRGPRRDDVERSLDALAEMERRPLELELPCLDLRVVEDVVDHVEQRVAARPDHLGELPLLGRQLRPEQQVRHADHPVHRRSDLVAHRGEERALGLRRRLGLFARALELRHVPCLLDRRGRVGGESLRRVGVLGRVEARLGLSG
jgi:hypothetical protein